MPATITVKVIDKRGAAVHAVATAGVLLPRAADRVMPEPDMDWTVSYERPRLGSGFPSPGTTGNLADMSLLKGVAGQKITFALINAANDAPLTGAAGTIVAWTNRDGGAQASVLNSFTELTPTGHGIYSYPFDVTETNGNCVSLFVTAPGAVPTNMMFLTSGLHRGVAGQHITFGMYAEANGAADPSASPSVLISQDGGSLSSGGGTFRNLGNGQYDYAPTAAETNALLMASFAFFAPLDVTVNIAIFVVP